MFPNNTVALTFIPTNYDLQKSFTEFVPPNSPLLTPKTSKKHLFLFKLCINCFHLFNYCS